MNPRNLRKFITRKGLFSRIPIVPSDRDVEPEMTLGRAVLDRALLDSFTDADVVLDSPWFDIDNLDFVTICYVAKLEPEKVVNVFKRVVTPTTSTTTSPPEE